MWWSQKVDPASYEAPSGIPSPDEVRELLLYKYDMCGYCRRVMRVIGELGLEVPLADTRQDPARREQLLQLTSRTQVPCLVIDGVPMLESADISNWLRAYAIRGGVKDD